MSNGGIWLPNGQQLVNVGEIDIDLGRTQTVLGEDGKPVMEEVLDRVTGIVTQVPKQVPLHFKRTVPNEPMQNGEFILLHIMVELMAETLREMIFVRGQVMTLVQIEQVKMQQQAQAQANQAVEPQGSVIHIKRSGPNAPNGRNGR